MEEQALRRVLQVACLLVATLFGAAAAAERFFVYNLTTSTEFTGVFLAPAGTQNWGANQALNDKDHSLDVTERLSITGIAHGRFDVKLQTEKGGTCVKSNVDLTKETSFDIRDTDIAGCR